MKNLLELKDISISFGGVEILHNISLQSERERFIL